MTPSAPTRPRALVADDEPHLARALVELLAELWPALEIVHVARHGLEDLELAQRDVA